MVIRFTPYAQARVQRRKLSAELVRRVVVEPQQVIEEDDRKVAQSRYVDPNSGKEYLLRVVYEQQAEGRLVVTVYKTSKIQKYWRPS